VGKNCLNQDAKKKLFTEALNPSTCLATLDGGRRGFFRIVLFFMENLAADCLEQSHEKLLFLSNVGAENDE